MDKEEFVADDLLESAVQFTSSSRFRVPIDDFIQAHAHTFQSTADSKSPESEELPHEYNVIFGEYQNLVDSLFDQLAKSRGFTTKALYSCFRGAGRLLVKLAISATFLRDLPHSCHFTFPADNKFTALFEENEYKWFVDKVMSWMDFYEFLNMMHAAAHERRRLAHK